MRIRNATNADLPAVENLLSTSDLPIDGVRDNFSSFLVEELYLLTTTADQYFPRFGFTHTTRAAVPDAVKASAEFHGACPDTAVVMTRRAGAAARTRA